jgi:alanine or glycine:cation symporter, AGCS family
LGEQPCERPDLPEGASPAAAGILFFLASSDCAKPARKILPAEVDAVAAEPAVVGLIDHVTNVSDFIWGGTWNGEQAIPLPPMVLILLGIGMYMMIGLRFYPIRKLWPAFKGVFTKTGDKQAGEISPFAALSTALSGQVGTGNLAGVATAIALGGPGAIFWMWITAIIGMALAFAEGALAIR